jgi:hypothetical protein
MARGDRAPSADVRALALTTAVTAAALLTGCSGAAGPIGPGPEEARGPVAPEERSTCEALQRVDLAVVGSDAGSRRRSATGLEDAAERSPAAIAPSFTALAAAYRTSATAAWDAPARADVVYWFNQRCGGTR